MHLILLTRGINHQVEMWKNMMTSQMFPWKRTLIAKDEKGNFLKNPDGTYQHGKEEMLMVQGALRPIQLWEYVFPKEHLKEVLCMLKQNKNYNDLRSEVAKVAWILRKGMGAKKIPDFPEIKDKEWFELTGRYVETQGVGVYPLGIRDDEEHDFIFGDQGYFQEGL